MGDGLRTYDHVCSWGNACGAAGACCKHEATAPRISAVPRRWLSRIRSRMLNRRHVQRGRGSLLAWGGCSAGGNSASADAFMHLVATAPGTTPASPRLSEYHLVKAANRWAATTRRLRPSRIQSCMPMGQRVRRGQGTPPARGCHSADGLDALVVAVAHIASAHEETHVAVPNLAACMRLLLSEWR